MAIQRNLQDSICADLEKKIVILSGPRQCGKTTLSKSLFKKVQYLNFDSIPDRQILTDLEWDRSVDMVIFDELHKMKKWKSWIKGIYDTEGLKPKLLVTGSARLTQFKKTGDSLAGRHFNYRLHPFDLLELKPSNSKQADEMFRTLLRVGGFPEPFLDGTERFYNRWRASHLDLILRQDLPALELVRDIKSIELLVHLLSERVGSNVSNSSLAQKIGRDPKTIARWIELLEDLFIIFRVTPFHENIERSIRKEPKYYFYDTGLILNGEPARFENLVACALLKEVQRLHDVDGIRGSLHYLKTKEGKEIDFCVNFEKHPSWLIEVKWADEELSANFRSFESHFKNSHRLQLVAEMKRDKTTPQGHQIRNASDWLRGMSLVTKIK